MKERGEGFGPDYVVNQAEEVSRDHQRWINIDSRKHAGWFSERELKNRFTAAQEIGDHELIYLWFTALVNFQFDEAVKEADHRLKWANDGFPPRPY